MFALTHINQHGVKFYENIDTKEHICCSGSIWWKDLDPTPSLYTVQIPTPEACRFLDN